jgi:hypothetical protein
MKIRKNLLRCLGLSTLRGREGDQDLSPFNGSANNDGILLGKANRHQSTGQPATSCTDPHPRQRGENWAGRENGATGCCHRT